MELILDIKQLGPVKDSRIVWRPLTVFIGPNNTGKTYTAYLIYGILTAVPVSCKLELKKIKTLFSNKKIRLNFESVKKKWIEVWQKGIKKYLISDFWEENFVIKNAPIVIEKIELKPEIVNEVTFEGSLEITGPFVEDEEPTIFDFFWDFIGKLEYKASLVKEKQSLYVSILKQEEHFFKDNLPDNIEEEKEIEYRGFHHSFCKAFATLLGLPPQSFIMPAERTAFFFYKEWFIIKDKLGEILTRWQLLKLQKKSKKDQSINNKRTELEEMLYSVVNEFRFPKIYEDFLDFLLLIEKAEPTKTYEKVITLLEEKLLRGKILIQSENFWFHYGEGAVEISGASSCVKALLLLEKFLRIAKKRAFLVIEEPELHLYPESQVILAIALAMAVNLGLRVLLTTHSSYILDTFNFLAWSYRIREKIKEIGLSSLEERFKNVLKAPPFEVPEEALLDPSRFSAYFFRTDGQVEDIRKIPKDVPEVDIDWSTFSQVSEALWEKLSLLGELQDEILKNEP